MRELTAPPEYGSWPSPLTAQHLTALSLRLAEPRLEGGDLYWLETRPHQQGRNALVRRKADGTVEDILPEPYSIRTRANEYGGAPWTLHKGTVYAVLDHDQRIYRYRDGELVPLTPEGPFRYADMIVDEPRQRLICVREDYRPAEPASTLVAVALDGSLNCDILVEGDDFYSNPRLSPDGTQLSWLSWNHPDMPWDNTCCRVAVLDDAGQVTRSEVIAGGHGESVFQPDWSAGGELIFVSDRSNWWNLYRYREGTIQALCPMEAEFATPQWVFGMSTWALYDPDTLICTFTRDGVWQLARLTLTSGQLEILPLEGINDISALGASRGTAVFIGAGPACAPALFTLTGDSPVQRCYPADSRPPLAAEYISHAEPLRFPTADGSLAHGFYYPPRNPAVTPPANQLPPLLVMCHGGPTGATSAAFNPKIQYWTSRGFAVVDVNYRGSTGYGRQYRNALHSRWGIADVEDVVAAANYLVSQQRVDGDKLAIRGSSAGGYTVLAALTFTDTFKAGASLYGIGNLESLATDTHKFESRYLDSLVGAWPEEQASYRARSPLFHTGQLQCPVIFLQGLQDKVVPPAQAEQMLAALARRGIPRAYVTFANEGHGFRQADNIVRAMEAELYFYSRVFKFPLAETITPVLIEDLPEEQP